jgi:DMSO/TMAO reductase YedYZ molybdopterin-dependent catalytic subunit
VTLITRGFTGRPHETQSPRLPPGQHQSDPWPVLAAEPTPRLDTDAWTFRVEGQVHNPATWNWEQIHALPESEYVGDIHCVTTWSRLGMAFSGVSVETLLGQARPLESASHVVVFSHTGYTTRGCPRRKGSGCVGCRWQALGEGARRARADERSTSVLLEEHQVGGWDTRA